MKKRLCVRGLALLLSVVAMLLLPGCRGVARRGDMDTKRLRVAHDASESYHLHKALAYFKDEMERTGMFHVELYPNGQVGHDVELLESAKTGDIDMNVTPSSYYTDEVPEFSFVEMPYVFATKEVAINTLAGPWGEEQAEKLHQSGLHCVGFMENGLRHLTNSVREITSPEQVTGLKFRTMPVPVHVYYWNTLGASAEGSPFPELYTNLSTKVFDGQENPIAHIYSSKLFEVQSYMTLTGHCYTTYMGTVNLDYWQALTDEEQKVIKENWEKAYAFQLDLIDQEEGVQLEEIQNSANFPTKITKLSPEQLQTFMDSAIATHDHYKSSVGEAQWERFMQAVQAAERME